MSNQTPGNQEAPDPAICPICAYSEGTHSPSSHYRCNRRILELELELSRTDHPFGPGTLVESVGNIE
jgi:hypothetical protein